jgi:segregation and condensation protein A
MWTIAGLVKLSAPVLVRMAIRGELSREHLIELTQAEAFAPIYVRLAYSPVESLGESAALLQ